MQTDFYGIQKAVIERYRRGETLRLCYNKRMKKRRLPLLNGFFAGVNSLIVVFTAALQAEVPQHKIYEVPNAEVVYSISGGGILSDDVNLTLEGSGKLRFRDWGAVELFETNITEKTTGALHYIDHKLSCTKRESDEILDVDFKTQKIRKRPLPEGKKARNITKGLSKNGQQQMIANVVCDMWTAERISKCIYKGIPLFTEYRVMGLYYREEAVSVRFDINVSSAAKCSVPKFPVEKMALFAAHFKTKHVKIPEAFSERLLEVISILNAKKSENVALAQREKEQAMHILAHPIFESQKKLLPALLQTMKKTRACLATAKNTDMANSCLYDMIALKNYFTQDPHNKIVSWEKERTTILDRFDKHITFLESRMKCVRSAQHFSDLAICMKR